MDLDGVTGAAMTLGKWAHRSADANKDGKVEKAEWDKAAGEFFKNRRDHGLIAVQRVWRVRPTGCSAENSWQ
jgi:hypothetical protein